MQNRVWHWGNLRHVLIKNSHTFCTPLSDFLMSSSATWENTQFWISVTPHKKKEISFFTHTLIEFIFSSFLPKDWWRIVALLSIVICMLTQESTTFLSMAAKITNVIPTGGCWSRSFHLCSTRMSPINFHSRIASFACRKTKREREGLWFGLLA